MPIQGSIEARMLANIEIQKPKKSLMVPNDLFELELLYDNDAKLPKHIK